uniref:Uncharacterized protein n=1 Tax=Anopheles atroparvus TaxID=41427 RepID=A0A182IPH4_ANOAO
MERFEDDDEVFKLYLRKPTPNRSPGMNVLLHSSHSCGRSFEWRLMCNRCCELVANVAGQSPQLNGLSPECTRRCSFRLPRWEKRFEQNSHSNGFTPLCQFRCTSRLVL